MSCPVKRVIVAAVAAAACAVVAAATEPSFAMANGWGPLTWTMNVADAKAALTRAGMPFDEVTLPGGDGPALMLKRARWEQTLVLFDAGGRLLAVDFVSPRLTAQAEAVVYRAELEKRYGPGEVVPGPNADDGYTDVETVRWQNDTTVLTLATTYYMPQGEWEVEVRYTLAPAPGGE